MYRPISLQNISISFANRDCFEDFSAKIYPGSSIAIIGKNGSGKSSLLNVLRGKLSPSSGEIIIPDDVQIAYVEQIIKEFDTLSGSQRLNKRLSEALGQFPDLLLLDEPTNHLDKDNRKSLIQMLRRYQGALVVVTHDRDLLRNCIDTLWYIDNNKIYEFNGSYDNYIEAIKQKRLSIEKDLSSINLLNSPFGAVSRSGVLAIDAIRTNDLNLSLLSATILCVIIPPMDWANK